MSELELCTHMSLIRISLVGLLMLLFIASVPNSAAYPVQGNFFSTTGSTINFDTYEGELVILDATATWCANCVEQIGILRSFQNTDPTTRIVTVGVDPNKDTVSDLGDLKNETNATWTFGLDENSYLIDQFGITVIPTLILLDEEGGLIKKWEQTTSAVEMLEAIRDFRNVDEEEIDNDLTGSSNQSSLISDFAENPIVHMVAIIGIVAVIYIKSSKKS